MKTRLVLAIGIVLLVSVWALGQRSSLLAKYSRLIESELACRSNPKAGKLLLNLRRQGFINRTYVVEDSVSYFKLNRRLRVAGFSPVAVFGFEHRYPRFFVRGPGTAPPETIGIVVRGSIASVKAKLNKLGLENLETEEHTYDFRGNVKESGSGLIQIGCWAKFSNQ